MKTIVRVCSHLLYGKLLFAIMFFNWLTLSNTAMLYADVSSGDSAGTSGTVDNPSIETWVLIDENGIRHSITITSWVEDGPWIEEIPDELKRDVPPHLRGRIRESGGVLPPSGTYDIHNSKNYKSSRLAVDEVVSNNQVLLFGKSTKFVKRNWDEWAKAVIHPNPVLGIISDREDYLTDAEYYHDVSGEYTKAPGAFGANQKWVPPTFAKVNLNDYLFLTRTYDLSTHKYTNYDLYTSITREEDNIAHQFDAQFEMGSSNSGTLKIKSNGQVIYNWPSVNSSEDPISFPPFIDAVVNLSIDWFSGVATYWPWGYRYN